VHRMLQVLFRQGIKTEFHFQIHRSTSIL
jgi:hypothetical protein